MNALIGVVHDAIFGRAMRKTLVVTQLMDNDGAWCEDHLMVTGFYGAFTQHNNMMNRNVYRWLQDNNIGQIYYPHNNFLITLTR
ncbi:hypothetical protein A4D02_25830 [Niastella koreensis]|uniref:Uncharacterized protein n=1 Tax=Niastella koreensis TaxID=354356 RepID=A0ABX3NZR6_9BACT|nr:hypothetical protein A4D02_25830 [Niastella koreensis]